MKKTKLIVFDIDGTLTDTVEQHQPSFKKALRDIGVDKIDANLNTFKHHTHSYILKAIFEQCLR